MLKNNHKVLPITESHCFITKRNIYPQVLKVSWYGRLNLKLKMTGFTQTAVHNGQGHCVSSPENSERVAYEVMKPLDVRGTALCEEAQKGALGY